MVTDLDRTFTDLGLKLDSEAVQAVGALRATGVTCILATGRDAPILDAWPELVHCFDGFVLEAGAVWGVPGAWHSTVDDANAVWRLKGSLEQAGVEVQRRSASLSIPRAAEHVMHGLPEAAACDGLPNAERLDVVPKGVDKGVGLRRLLQHRGVEGGRIVAIGDSENDVALFAASDYGLAVANAVPALRAVADEVAPHPAAAGFVWVLRNRLVRPSGG